MISALFTKGDVFHQSFKVSDEVYERFIEVYKDKNPLHTSEEFAKAKGFKDKVMHGNILNGFISYFIGEGLPTKDVIIHTQEIQYKLPVYLNDQLTFEAIVNEVFESVKAVEFKFTFRNGDSKVVSKGKIQIGILI